MSNFIQVTPFMHVDDLDRAVTFFTDIMGFQARFRAADLCWSRRARTAPRPAISFAYYIDVRDVDRLYAELKPKLDTLPKGDVYGPVDQSYGQRELMVLAPDGNLFAFGQAIGGE